MKKCRLLFNAPKAACTRPITHERPHPQNPAAFPLYRAGRNHRLLAALFVAAAGQKRVVAAACRRQPGAVCLSAYPASCRQRADLCGIRRRVHHHRLVLAARCRRRAAQNQRLAGRGLVFVRRGGHCLGRPYIGNSNTKSSLHFWKIQVQAACNLIY